MFYPRKCVDSSCGGLLCVPGSCGDRDGSGAVEYKELHAALRQGAAIRLPAKLRPAAPARAAAAGAEVHALYAIGASRIFLRAEALAALQSGQL